MIRVHYKKICQKQRKIPLKIQEKWLQSEPKSGTFLFKTIWIWLRTAHLEKNQYKIEFWCYENPMPQNEENSTVRIKEK